MASKERALLDEIEFALEDTLEGSKWTVEKREPTERGAWQTTERATVRWPDGSEFEVTVTRTK